MSRRRLNWEDGSADAYYAERFPNIYKSEAQRRAEAEDLAARREAARKRLRRPTPTPRRTGAQMADELDKLALKARHSRQAAEDALRAYLERLKFRTGNTGQSEQDLHRTYPGLDPSVMGDR